MFRNIYGKRIIRTLRNKDVLIWTWIFPLMMATLFYFTFTSLDTAQQLRSISLAVVNNADYQQDAIFRAVLEAAAEDAETPLFTLTMTDREEEADTMLEDGTIDGYIRICDSIPLLTVSNDGMEQTIIKGFLDNYLQSRSALKKQIQQDPDAARQFAAAYQRTVYTKEISLTQNPPTEKVGYFYALLAMVCLYGGFQGLTTISQMQANLSPLGARCTMSPAGRFRTLFYDLLGGLTVQLCFVLVLVAYILFVLGVDFGNQLGLVLLTCLVGSLTGVSFGALVSVTAKLKETAKTAVLIGVTLLCCFLSGLMVGGINYVIAEKAPAVAWLNPAARITDAFYCLYYYDTYGRYIGNIAILLAMAAFMLVFTTLFVRRQRYESI